MGLVDEVVFRGISCYRFGLFPFRINSTVWTYRTGPTLFDTGPPNQWKHVREVAKRHNVGRVIISHHHEDHSGNGYNFQQEMGLPVYAPDVSVELISSGFPLKLYRHVFWGKPTPFTPLPLSSISCSEDWDFHSAPGHSHDHTVVLLKQEGVLLASDLYVTRFPKSTTPGCDPIEEMASLERILKLDFDAVLCGHKGVVEDGKQAISLKLEYMKNLQAQARDFLDKGLPLTEVTRKLVGNETYEAYVTGFDLCKLDYVKKLTRGSRDSA